MMLMSQKLSLEWNKEQIVAYIDNYNFKSKNPTYMPFNIQKIKNPKLFKELSIRQKRIIFNELNQEYLFDDDIYGTAKKYHENIKYAFSLMNPKELPASQWESLRGDERIFDKKKLIGVFKNVQKLERKIKKEGYNKNKPVTLDYIPNQKNVVISMGNHRLQAVRNLIQKKQLSPSFKLPILFVIHDNKLMWKLRTEEKKLRKEAFKKTTLKK